MTSKHHKAVIHRLITEVFNDGQLQALDELYHTGACRTSPIMDQSVPALVHRPGDGDRRAVAEGQAVAARFVCSGTHTGEWQGHPPTGRRFRRVPEVYFFTFDAGRISKAWGLEDTYRLLQQLGLA